MSSSTSRKQRRQERDVRVKFRKNDLPPAQKAQLGDTTVLRGHGGSVEHVVAIPESGLIATASNVAPGLRIFALDGDGEPLHVCSDAKSNLERALTALGGDVLAYGDIDCSISTWCASSGARLEVVQLGDWEYATAMAPSGLGKFVVGTNSGALVFFSHREGRDLHEVARGNVSHGDCIRDIAVRGYAIVTASDDKTAAVWSAATRERVAVLRGHSSSVWCAAVCARFIATGSVDETIRLYEAGKGHALVRVIEGLHSNWVYDVGFVVGDILMSASSDHTVAFTSLSSDKPIARLDAGFAVWSASITPDARVACAGYDSDAAIFSPPALVATAVENHVATVFPSSQSLTFAENEPLQAAMVDVLEGSRGAGDACRALVSEEHCSRSIEEWTCAHRLLMAAVANKDIIGELDFESGRNYWFENLYTQVRRLPMGRDDLEIVKECLYQAKTVGVIEVTETVLTAVMLSRDFSEEVTKLRIAGHKMLSIICEIAMTQAKADAQMRKLGAQMRAMDRTQKLNAIFGFVFSFVPLGGNALAQSLVGANQVWSLLDSATSAGVGIHGAVTPLLLGKFFERSSLMISPEGWESMSIENQATFKELVEALGSPWEEFCDTIRKASAQRGLEVGKAIEDSAEGENDICEVLGDSSSVPEVIDDISSHVGRNLVTSFAELQKDDQYESSSGLGAGVAISSTANKDEALVNFGELKMAISDVETLLSMTIENLSKSVAAVMINFAEDLCPQFLVLASCLRNVFHKKAISGDILVGFPKDVLLNQIVNALREDEKYQVLNRDDDGYFEWRLDRFLSGLRSE